MFRSKLFAVLTLTLFFSGIAMLDCAVAGEKFKAHGTSIGVEWEQMEIGDEEGHVVGISKSKQIYIDENTGEKSTSVSIGLLDINPKKGQVSGHGYGVSTYKDGSKAFRSWDGKAVGKGHWKGTWSVIGGTGKYEGAKGGGTWDSYSLAPQHSYLDVEGEVELAGQ